MDEPNSFVVQIATLLKQKWRQSGVRSVGI